MSVMRKMYVLDGGDTVRSAKPDWKALRFELFGAEKDKDGKAIVVDTVDVARGDLESVAAEAMGHGLMQKIGDDLAGLEGKAKSDEAAWDDETGYAEYVRERIEAMVDNLSNGVWLEEGEGATGGGNVTILLEAVVRAYADEGREVTPEDRKALLAKLADKAIRDDTKKLESVARYVTVITAERAQERANKAMAKDVKPGGLGLL